MADAIIELPPGAVFSCGGDVFTTSTMVAEVFGKRHDNVLRDIGGLLKSEETLRRHFTAAEHVDGQNGQTYRFYKITRDGLALLAMGFTGAKAMRWKMAFLDAFNGMEAELRARVADPRAALRDPAALRTLLLEQTEQVLALQADVAALTPKADALDRLAAVPDGSICVTDAAKMLGVRPKDLFGHLARAGWIYRRPGASAWLAYQARIAAGLAEHRVVTIERPDGTEKVVSRLLITPKGLAKLAQDLPGARGAAAGASLTAATRH